MVKEIAGSKVLLLGSGFGMKSIAPTYLHLHFFYEEPAPHRKKLFLCWLTLFLSILVTKPTVEVLSKADVHVTVGMFGIPLLFVSVVVSFSHCVRRRPVYND